MFACVWGAFSGCFSGPAANQPEPLAPDAPSQTLPETPAHSVSAVASAPTIAVSSASASSKKPVEPPPYSTSTIGALQTQVTTLLSASKKAGVVWSIAVIDEKSGQSIVDLDAEKLLVPASNTKLFTCASAFGLLGATHQSTTKVWASAPPDNNGEVDTLYLIGDHDSTWSKLFFAKGIEPIESLVEQVKAAGIRKIKTALVVAGEPLVMPERFHELDVAKHRVDVASHLRLALGKRNIRGGSTKVESTFTVPKGAHLVASLKSPELFKVCEPIGQLSHNEMADALLRHIAHEKANDPGYLIGAEQEKKWLGENGIDLGNGKLVDGSGLSRSNNVSARNIVDLLRFIHEQPWATQFENTLAVAQEKGTLQRRLKKPELKGKFFGKTGSLEGVAAVSGILIHPKTQRRILISILANNAKDAQAIRGLQDKVIGLVSDGLGQGGGSL